LILQEPFMVKMKWTDCSRWLGLAILAGFAVSVFTPFWNVAGQQLAVTAQLRPADAIVVLAAGLLPDGSLSDESLRRMFEGLVLYKTGLAPRIVLSGPPLSNGSAVEAEIRASLAARLGVPQQAIFQETAVHTTRDEAFRIWERFGSEAPSFLLVTESLHMRRAMLVFERAGFQVFPAPSDNLSGGAGSTFDRLNLMRRVLQETGALIYYQAAGYI
jgi:uncharacterized SAM-binding protein YcdF (DUF218 family)